MTQSQSRTFSLGRLVSRGGVFVVLVGLSQWVQEWYPVSHFPMYSAFSSSQWYVYVLDQDGEPVPVERDFATRTAYLKKVYIRNIGKYRRQQSKAVKTTLQFLADRRQPPATAKSLTLMVGQIKRKDERVDVQTRRLGSLRL